MRREINPRHQHHPHHHHHFTTLPPYSASGRRVARPHNVVHFLPRACTCYFVLDVAWRSVGVVGSHPRARHVRLPTIASPRWLTRMLPGAGMLFQPHPQQTNAAHGSAAQRRESGAAAAAAGARSAAAAVVLRVSQARAVSCLPRLGTPTEHEPRQQRVVRRRHRWNARPPHSATADRREGVQGGRGEANKAERAVHLAAALIALRGCGRLRIGIAWRACASSSAAASHRACRLDSTSLPPLVSGHVMSCHSGQHYTAH